MSNTASQFSGSSDPLRALSLGRTGAVDDPTVEEMRKNRRVLASASRSSSISAASYRPDSDPMAHWTRANLPYQTDTPEGLKKVRDYSRILYQTHPIIASATDVFSKYPLAGLSLTCKDDALVDFYETLFFDQLDYESYLQDIGREYWTAGEAWPLGSFNETLGVWDDDELIHPDDVEVIKSPFLREPRFQMRIPKTIRDIVTSRTPEWEYKQLVESYPELVTFGQGDNLMPVSGTLLKQIPFKADTFNPRGVPLLLRGFRAVHQEEALNSAMDAISGRMSTPLILAKLGASASDLGTSQPWIPTQQDISHFEESLDSALAADFRVLTHHFALNLSSVFGRENMPNFNPDFDRLTARILQVYGISQTMLSGAEGGKTYASDSINRDLVSQLLSSYQRLIKRFFRQRALVVAEAQEHFDYEERGGIRYPIMEEVLEVDPESGEQRIVEKPKLLVPELNIRAMTMKDESDERQFLEALRASGVPISMRTRLVNAPLKLDEERERSRQEAVEMAIEAQETRKATYEALRGRGLPIPQDLIDDFAPKATVGDSDATQPAATEGVPLPNIGTLEVDTEALVPVEEAEEDGEGEEGASLVSLPRNRSTAPESYEEMGTMPKAGSLVTMGGGGKVQLDLWKEGGWTKMDIDPDDKSIIINSRLINGVPERDHKITRDTNLNEYYAQRDAAK